MYSIMSKRWLLLLFENDLIRHIYRYLLVTAPRWTVTVTATPGFTVLITVVLVTFLMVTQRVPYKKDLLKHISQYLLVTVPRGIVSVIVISFTILLTFGLVTFLMVTWREWSNETEISIFVSNSCKESSNRYRYIRFYGFTAFLIVKFVTFLIATQRLLYNNDLIRHISRYLLVTVPIGAETVIFSGFTVLLTVGLVKLLTVQDEY